MDYPHKVAWCPICQQGWVEIVEDRKSKDLLLVCTECESEWADPSHIDAEHVQSYRSDAVETTTWSKIQAQGWAGYVIEREN